MLRAAIVSGNSEQAGKTALSYIIGNLYTRVTGEKSTIVATQNIKEMLDYVISDAEERDVTKSIDIMISLLKNNTILYKDMPDYAYKGKNILASLYDIYSEVEDSKDRVDKFEYVLSKLEKDFILIDISGKLDKERESIIDKSDVIIYVLTNSKKSAKAFRDFYNRIPENEQHKVIPVVNKYDSKSNTQKTMASIIGIPVSKLIFIPYMHNIERAMMEGKLDSILEYIYKGTHELAEIRLSMHKILVKMFNDKSTKFIKDVREWY